MPEQAAHEGWQFSHAEVKAACQTQASHGDRNCHTGKVLEFVKVGAYFKGCSSKFT